MSYIDVANCIYYQECIQFEDGEEIYHICNDDKNPTTYCQDSYNCYYKQLQQAKQDIKKAKKYNYDAGQQLIRMSQEVQQLKDYIKEDLAPTCQRLQKENDELKEIRENLHKCNKKIMDEKHNISIKNIKYKQCLDKIEGICDFNYTKENTRILTNEILQLIKQAKEGGE